MIGVRVRVGARVGARARATVRVRDEWQHLRRAPLRGELRACAPVRVLRTLVAAVAYQRLDAIGAVVRAREVVGGPSITTVRLVCAGVRLRTQQRCGAKVRARARARVRVRALGL